MFQAETSSQQEQISKLNDEVSTLDGNNRILSDHVAKEQERVCRIIIYQRSGIAKFYFQVEHLSRDKAKAEKDLHALENSMKNEKQDRTVSLRFLSYSDSFIVVSRWIASQNGDRIDAGHEQN